MKKIFFEIKKNVFGINQSILIRGFTLKPISNINSPFWTFLTESLVDPKDNAVEEKTGSQSVGIQEIFPEIGSHIRGNSSFLIEHCGLETGEGTFFDNEIKGILGFKDVPSEFDSTEIGIAIIESVGPIATQSLCSAEGGGSPFFGFHHLTLV